MHARRLLLAACLLLATTPAHGGEPAVSVSRRVMELRASQQDSWEWIAAPGLNAIVPGSGHLAEGRYGSGAALLGLSGALLGGALYANENDDETLRNNLLVLYQNVGFVSAYEQYVHRLSESARAGGQTPPEGTSWRGLVSAPLHGPSLRSPEVLLPLVALGGLATWAVLASDDAGAPRGGEIPAVGALLTGQSMGIGLGEELLFRGVALAELSAQLESETKAWLLQAAIFGGAHLDPEAEPADNLAHMAFATGFGLYAGWMATKRDWGLRKAIALHAWWDAIVFVADYLEDGTSEPLYMSVGGSF